ncbi:MAG: peptidoglycan DD-metalloendopeptidase family protein [Burkholderiales bacterium]|nr:peptidoglycan DD-metalloendopeptidase family protein [Bacteroidia bacterium]
MRADRAPLKDTTRLKINTSSISSNKIGVTKLQLVKLVDSLLDLSVIEEKEIELISYYNSILTSNQANLTIVKCGNFPATNFYDDFDESTVFQIIPDCEFPDSQIIKIESDSLGIYHHPKEGPVNSKFGWRDGKMHKGIDINLHKGDAIVAAFDGMVRIAHVKGAYGNVVIIRHYNGLETVYAHLSKIKVKPGQVVLAGQLIGLGGSTGRSSGPHLHFEVRFKGQALNPSSIISFTDNKTFNDSIVIKKSRYGICAYPSNATLHTIERGDTWYEVAKRYGLSMKELCVLNGIEKRYYLKPGQKLRVN